MMASGPATVVYRHVYDPGGAAWPSTLVTAAPPVTLPGLLVGLQNGPLSWIVPAIP
jgi:hypothetical protein